jgi:hypothetical protein
MLFFLYDLQNSIQAINKECLQMNEISCYL